LLGLFFDPEDGGDMLLRNIGWLSTDYTTLYPRRRSVRLNDRQAEIPTECLHNIGHELYAIPRSSAWWKVRNDSWAVP
jgi:hypothetical protein